MKVRENENEREGETANGERGRERRASGIREKQIKEAGGVWRRKIEGPLYRTYQRKEEIPLIRRRPDQIMCWLVQSESAIIHVCVCIEASV